MANLIKLTRQYTDEVMYVNTAHIISILPDREGSYVHLSESGNYRFKETTEQIIKLCNSPAPVYVIPPMRALPPEL